VVSDSDVAGADGQALIRLLHEEVTGHTSDNKFTAFAMGAWMYGFDPSVADIDESTTPVLSGTAEDLIFGGTIVQPPDLGITQSTQATVAGYTDIDITDRLYDRAADWKMLTDANTQYPTIKTKLIAAEGNLAAVDIGTVLVIDSSAASVFAVDTGTGKITVDCAAAFDPGVTFAGIKADIITFLNSSTIGDDLILTGLVQISEAMDLTGVVINGDLRIQISADTSLDFSNVQISGNVFNDAGLNTLTINLSNGSSVTTTEPGTGDGLVNILNPVETKITVKDEAATAIKNARVFLEASDGTGDLPFEDTVTITRSGTIASVSHTAHGMLDGDPVVIRGANQSSYNGVFVISNVTVNAYDYNVGANLALQSEDWTVSPWNIASSVITADAAVAPDQNMTADDARFTADQIIKQIITVDADTIFCYSLHLKQGDVGAHDWMQIRYKDNASGNGIQAWFRLDTGVAGTAETFGSGTTLTASGIIDEGDGWFRCWIAGQLASGITAGLITVDNVANNQSAVSETTDTVYYWGAQLEQASLPGRYRRTVLTAVALPTTPATGTIKATGVIISGLTDSSGEVSLLKSWTLSQPFTGTSRKSSTSPFYQSVRFDGLIDASLGHTSSITLLSDE